MSKPINTWDDINKIATYILTDNKGRKFIGTAKCHPDDIDFGNKLTGTTIAAYRATIKYLQSVKCDILEPELASLNQLYYSMNKSKQFNPYSYEAHMLQRQIRMKKDDLVVIKEELTKIKQELKSYITNKDIAYKKLRKIRAESEHQDEIN